MEFKEVGRITISEKTDIVVSSAVRDGKKVGVTINKFVTTDKYIGYSPAVLIPTKDIKQVIKLLGGA